MSYGTKDYSFTSRQFQYGNVHKGRPIFYLPIAMSYAYYTVYIVHTIYLCTMSDFYRHTYLPKNQTSFMYVPYVFFVLQHTVQICHILAEFQRPFIV